MELVDMKVQDIELVRKATDAIKLEHVVGNRVVYIGIETQSHRCATDQVGARHRISAGEQGHVMTQPDQFIGAICAIFIFFSLPPADARGTYRMGRSSAPLYLQ